MALVCRARLDSLWTANRLAAAGFISNQRRDVCPFCMGSKETLVHLVLHCRRWTSARAESGLEDLVKRTTRRIEARGGGTYEPGMNHSNTDKMLIMLLLGGEIGGVRGWDSAQDMVAVAQYLQQVWAQRYKVLGRLLDAHTEDRSRKGRVARSRSRTRTRAVEA